MATSIPYRKIYIDSRYCTKDSKSSSNFKVELPVTTQLPDNCVFFVTDVSIPHSWHTIEEGINDTLYLMSMSGSGVFTGYVVRLSPQNYTPTEFRLELQLQLRNTVNNSFSVILDNNSGVVIGNRD